jgi:hypothetical protein
LLPIRCRRRCHANAAIAKTGADHTRAADQAGCHERPLAACDGARAERQLAVDLDPRRSGYDRVAHAFVKPDTAVAMTFSNDPQMGIVCEKFTGLRPQRCRPPRSQCARFAA